MPNEDMPTMNRSIGELTAEVKGLRRDMDGVLTYMKEQNAVVDNHETRIAHLEDCEKRQGDNLKIVIGAIVAILVGIVGAWLKVTLGL